jgi:acetylglutamate kinase
MTPHVLKFGGELLEQPARLAAIAATLAQAAIPLVVVHGGGREIDAALARAGIAKQQVDGLRVTDEPTLNVVVEVLAGAVNTRLVAAINAAGGRAVGLTGADAGIAPVTRSTPFRSVSGAVVDLGLVGQPTAAAPPALAIDLVRHGYLPVVASVAATTDGVLLNVNADTLAANLAGRLKAARLIIAGATAGVLDASGRTIPVLDRAATDALIGSGVANAGMVAKLRACRDALEGGAQEVWLVDGREPSSLRAALTASAASTAATRMVA